MANNYKGSRRYVEGWRDKYAPNVEIIDEIPAGWRVISGAYNCPLGAKWVGHGSRFWRINGLEKYEHALLYTGLKA